MQLYAVVHDAAFELAREQLCLCCRVGTQLGTVVFFHTLVNECLCNIDVHADVRHLEPRVLEIGYCLAKRFSFLDVIHRDFESRVGGSQVTDGAEHALFREEVH